MTGIRYIAQSAVAPIVAMIIGTIAYATFLWPGMFLSLAVVFAFVWREWLQTKRSGNDRSSGDLSSQQVAKLLRAVEVTRDDGDGDNGNGNDGGAQGGNSGRDRRAV